MWYVWYFIGTGTIQNVVLKGIRDLVLGRKCNLDKVCQYLYLVGTGTSVRPPSVVACASRTKATKGLSRKSTSPTRTLEASASLGIFFMNLFFSCSHN